LPLSQACRCLDPLSLSSSCLFAIHLLAILPVQPITARLLPHLPFHTSKQDRSPWLESLTSTTTSWTLSP
jgi:hypothetical protein